MTFPHLLINHEKSLKIKNEENYNTRTPPLDGHVIKCYNLPLHIREGIFYYLLDIQKNAEFEIKKVIKPVEEETNLYPWKVICNDKFAKFLLKKEKIQIYDDLKNNNRVLVRLINETELNGKTSGLNEIQQEENEGKDKEKKEPQEQKEQKKQKEQDDSIHFGKNDSVGEEQIVEGRHLTKDLFESIIIQKRDETKGSIFRFTNCRRYEKDEEDISRLSGRHNIHVASSCQNYESIERNNKNKGNVYDDQERSRLNEIVQYNESYLNCSEEIENERNRSDKKVHYCLYNEKLVGVEAEDDIENSEWDYSEVNSERDLFRNGFDSESSFSIHGEGISKWSREKQFRHEVDETDEGDETDGGEEDTHEKPMSTEVSSNMNKKRREYQDHRNYNPGKEKRYRESYESNNVRNRWKEKYGEIIEKKDFSSQYVENRNYSNTSDTKSGSELKSTNSSYRYDDTRVLNCDESIFSNTTMRSKNHSSNNNPSNYAKVQSEEGKNKNNRVIEERNICEKRRNRKYNCDIIQGIINEQNEIFKKLKKLKKREKKIIGIKKITIYFYEGNMEEIIQEIREEDVERKISLNIDPPIEEKKKFFWDNYGWRIDDDNQDVTISISQKIKDKGGNENENKEEENKMEEELMQMQQQEWMGKHDQRRYNTGDETNGEKKSDRRKRNKEVRSCSSGTSGRSLERRIQKKSCSMDRRSKQECIEQKRRGSMIWPSNLGWKEISEEIKEKLCVVIKNKPAEWSDYDLRKFIESQFSSTDRCPVFEDIFLTKSCPTIATVAFKNEILRENFLKHHKFKLPSSIKTYTNDRNYGSSNNTSGNYYYNNRYSNFLTLEEYMISRNGTQLNNQKKHLYQKKRRW
ncbi:hypothetical protein, conserved [Plasmodium gonderi]|uniref:Uncharacterized protein n=1 Tax=Plasmodium gonderi TaxID=77519 RepID=A0A1Y1JGR5_PLAGO|nr:hypothetical protein, conserved [Plasmodium gonderi]GAW79633.1 hypothetical protein, conserved [Plasmodium gonderi]